MLQFSVCRKYLRFFFLIWIQWIQRTANDECTAHNASTNKYRYFLFQSFHYYYFFFSVLLIFLQSVTGQLYGCRHSECWRGARHTNTHTHRTLVCLRQTPPCSGMCGCQCYTLEFCLIAISTMCDRTKVKVLLYVGLWSKTRQERTIKIIGHLTRMYIQPYSISFVTFCFFSFIFLFRLLLALSNRIYRLNTYKFHAFIPSDII